MSPSPRAREIREVVLLMCGGSPAMTAGIVTVVLASLVLEADLKIGEVALSLIAAYDDLAEHPREEAS